MLTIDTSDWKKRIERAIKLAQNRNKPILISDVICLNEGDPITFFHNSSEGKRFFWRDSQRQFTLVGCGIAHAIFLPAIHNRYERVEEERQKILHSGLIFGKQIIGTGPLLFGGFSFDPLKQKTQLWDQFNDSHFYIPAYMMTQNDKGTFLTINIVVEPHSKLEHITLPDETFFQKLIVDDEKKETIIHSIESVHDIAVEEWMTSMEQVIKRIQQIEIEKVVLAREVRLKLNEHASISGILQNIIDKEQSSYIFALESGKDCFIGATPERLVRKEGTQLLSTCLAGSTPRGKSEVDDEKLGNALLMDTKNKTEHQFVVDMIREALEPVCDELVLPNEPVLMKLHHIQHLYTPVVGVCNENLAILPLLETLHPTPALGGWPKEKSVEIIREIEPLDRGLYGAPIGWMDAHRNGEFVVAIRSALIRGNEISLFAGCGVVENSVPEEEFQETGVKIKPMLTAIGGVHCE